MAIYYRIWGKVLDDKGESLIAETFNAKPIKKNDIDGVCWHWQKRIPINDIRIEAYQEKKGG